MWYLTQPNPHINTNTAQFLLCKGADDEEDRGLFDDLLGSVDDAIFGNPMVSQ